MDPNLEISPHLSIERRLHEKFQEHETTPKDLGDNQISLLKNTETENAHDKDEAFQASIISALSNVTNDIKVVKILTKKYTTLYENVKCIPINSQVNRLQTIIRNIISSRTNFCFAADRLIRLVIESGLNLLPVVDEKITTPGGYTFNGCRWSKPSCGVSIIRSGEAMEVGLRDCCRSIRIGKILVYTDDTTGEATVFYSKFPQNVNQRIILLMYPILRYGNAVLESIKVLEQHGVKSKQIILLNLFATPEGIELISQKYPQITILTTEIAHTIPGHFSTKYFGTN